jgi:nickel-type superoxide dismutase maturation protease
VNLTNELQHSNREFLLWLLRRRRRVRVVEESMLPLLKPGDELLYDPHAYRKRSPVKGDLVVAMHPIRPNFKLVKRITAINADGTYFLEGDNFELSTDSREFGSVAGELLIGRITSRFGT